MPDQRDLPADDEPVRNPHDQAIKTFARVFANEAALLTIDRNQTGFAPGSVIVREKLNSDTDARPELVTVMVKREKGFSPKTGDWEYFVIDGDLGKVRDRQKTGSCSSCHSQAAATDWVFRQYLR